MRMQGQGRASNLRTRDRSCMDDDPQPGSRLHHIFSFLKTKVRKQTWIFLFFHFALKGPQNFKSQVQLHIPTYLQLNDFCDSEGQLMPSHPP